MASWYAKVVNDPSDITVVLDACDYFDDEYTAAVAEVDMQRLRGTRVEELQKRIPGIVGFRDQQLQEIEAIVGLLELRETSIRGARRRHYLEHYVRALTPTTVEKYVDADEEVIAMATLRNRVGLVRNKYLGLSKQHNYLHFQLGNLTRLIAAGVNDAVL